MKRSILAPAFRGPGYSFESDESGCPAHAGMELLAVIERTPAERETVAWRK